MNYKLTKEDYERFGKEALKGLQQEATPNKEFKHLEDDEGGIFYIADKRERPLIKFISKGKKPDLKDAKPFATKKDVLNYLQKIKRFGTDELSEKQAYKYLDEIKNSSDLFQSWNNI